MEPIGQKVLTPKSEELLVTGDIDENSLENITKEIFDETLENVLLEMNDGKDLLAHHIEKDNVLDPSLSIDLTKDILTSVAEEVPEKDIKKVSNSDIAMEVMEEILLTADGSDDGIEKLQNSEKTVSVISDSRENDFRIKETNFDYQEDFVKKIERDVEMDGSKKDISNNQLQTFFHSKNRKDEPEILDELPEFFQQQNDTKNFQSVGTNSELFSQDALQLESPNLKSVLPDQKIEESIEEISSHSNFRIDNGISKKNSSNDIGEILKNSDIADNSIQQNLTNNINQQNKVDRDVDLRSASISDSKLDRLNIPEQLQTNSITNKVEVKTDTKNFEIENLERQTFRSNEISKNIFSSKPEVNLPIEGNLKEEQDFKLTSERFSESSKLSITDDTIKIGKFEKEITEVSSEKKLKSKNFDNDIQLVSRNDIKTDNSTTKERVNQTFSKEESLIFANQHKSDLQEKTNDTRNPQMANFRVSEEQKILLREQSKDIGTPLPNNFQVPEEKKIAVKEVPNEIILEKQNVKSSEDQKFASKVGKDIETDSDLKHFLDDSQITDQIKTYSNFKTKDKDFGKEFSENITIEKHQSINKILSSQEVDSLSNPKALFESTNNSPINTLNENTSVFSVKSNEASNTLSEPLRNLDLPFDIEKVLGRVRVMSGKGVEEMTLQLKPEELGQITLKIRQSGAELTIDMRVDNPQVKQLIESGFDILRNRFLDNEFSYQDLALNVDINERDPNFGRDRRNPLFEESLTIADKAEKQEVSSSEEKISTSLTSETGLNLYV